MNTNPPHQAISGASMDKIVPKRRGKSALIAGAIFVVVLIVGYLIWHAMPRGLQVAATDVSIGTAEKGIFQDNIIVRASAAPLHSIILDSVEVGRVEEVSVRDGAMVNKGQLLFRLSNPQRNIELLARQAERAQQISNLSNLRVMQEASRTEHQRRLSDLKFALAQGEKKHDRDIKLASQGFISAVALDESGDLLLQQKHALQDEIESSEKEAVVRSNAQTQMESAIDGLQSGLQLVQASVEALAVRAPSSGRLTGFSLEVGQTVKTNDRIGRIDDPTQFKLTALVDEFYLNRISVGRAALMHQGDKDYAVEVSALYPQIKSGRFAIDMVFKKDQPETISPGQSMDTQITLGEPSQALLLPNGPFVNDSGGGWVFVLGADGKTAEKRTIKIGRRNNSQIELLSGLLAGEKVIISGYTAFGNTQRLQLTN
jgi:HlyD family secretion protein